MALIQARDPAAQRLHVFPDLRTFVLAGLRRVSARREPQIRFKASQRGGEIIEVIGEEPAIAELTQRGRLDGEA